MPARRFLARSLAVSFAFLVTTWATAAEKPLHAATGNAGTGNAGTGNAGTGDRVKDDAVAGIVQDRNQSPVAQATVFVIDDQNEVKATTNERGEFRLELADISPPGAFLFADANGFRFHGQPLKAAEKDSIIVLHRDSETIDERTAGKDWLISHDERMKLVHRVFEPYLQRMLDSDKDADKLRPLEVLAKIDPPRALEICEQEPFQAAHMGMIVRGKVMEQFASEDADAAVEVAEGFEDTYMRAYSFMRITLLSNKMSKADRTSLLSRAAADAKSIKNPAQRIGMLGLVAGALYEAGEQASAEQLLRDTEQAASQISGAAWAGFVRGSFAEKLALIDLEAALPMVTDLSDANARNRHFGNMAQGLASIKPADAERVLNMIVRPAESRFVVDERDQYAIRVCYQMALKDLPRSKRIADACHENNLQAYAHGLIAHAIAESDRGEATKQLRHAYKLLNEGIRGPQVVKIHSAQVAGALLATAERIDPTLVQEMVWRTISLRTPRDASQPYGGWCDQQTSQLAGWLSRYDRESAATVLDHWHSGKDMPYTRDQYSFALAMVDPVRAVEYAESQLGNEIPSSAPLTVARTLASEGDSRIHILHREIGLWPIGARDLDW